MRVRFGRFCLAASFVCGILSTGPAARAEGDNGDIESITVDIQTIEGHGIGVLLNKTGRILTSAHVAATVALPECRVEARAGADRQTAKFAHVSVVGFHPKLDLALIQIDSLQSEASLPAPKLARQKASVGQRVQLVLNASVDGLETSKNVTGAELGEAVRAPDGQMRYPVAGPTFTTANVGGPVCDAAGRLLGIVSGEICDKQFTAILIPIGDVSDPARFVPFNKRTINFEAAKVLLAAGDGQVQWGDRVAHTNGSDDSEVKLHVNVAAAYYRQAVVEDPTSAKCFYYAGDALHTLGKADAAARYLMLAIDREPWSVDKGTDYRELGLSLAAPGAKGEHSRIVWKEGVAKFPRAPKIWEDLTVSAANDKRAYDAAYYAAIALRVSDQRTRTEVLQGIHDRFRGQLAASEQDQLAEAERKIDQMLRDREDAADRARRAGKRFFDPACEDLIVAGTCGIFSRAAAAPAEETVAAAPADEPEATEPETPAGPLEPVPSVQQQNEATKNVKEVYGQDLAAAHTADDKVALAKKLLATANETDKDKSKDVAVRFVLLRMARDFAVQGGDLDTALAAINETGRTFEVDSLEMQCAALARLASTVHGKDQHKAIATRSLAAVRAALAKDNLALAKQAASTARVEAGHVGDRALIKEAFDTAHDVDSVVHSFDAVKPSLETLKKNPEDAAANLAVGKYKCLIKGAWQEGLPLLAKGSDAALKDLAQKELAGVDSSEGKAALGDQWWDAGEKLDAIPKRRARGRAVYWYNQALPELSGLAKVKIERRVKQVAAELVESQLPTEKPSPAAPRHKLHKSELVGGKGGTDFEDLPEKRTLLVGFDITLGTWAEKPVPFVWSLQPVYAGGDGVFATKVYGNRTSGKVRRIAAKPGYAVAGMTLNAENLLTGFKLQFMRVRGARLDPNDSYESEWIGGDWGSQHATLAGDGKPVIGCFGRSADAIDVIGLIQGD